MYILEQRCGLKGRMLTVREGRVEGQDQHSDVVHWPTSDGFSHQLFGHTCQVFVLRQVAPDEVHRTLRGDDVPQAVRGNDSEFSLWGDDFRVDVWFRDDQGGRGVRLEDGGARGLHVNLVTDGLELRVSEGSGHCQDTIDSTITQ